ncbi:hypothetical protein [Blastococcus sp. CT_GayMR16]|uniref:hypothetical protein n=1 Tax=Blastococcus sp. CT_GayMR16 TaxID=2559607 RepID=UPI001073DAA3|nr:hypothetical protein [Blastococcus sp. CT_GayMR16]TFV87801.1 hypothetical protein E4P38_12570 [Blastococcus sp. CT_GayMR16]
MRPATRPLLSRALVVSVAAAVLTGSVSLGTLPARADDEPAPGVAETVVGEFAQIWPEYEEPGEASEYADEGPLSYVRTDDGETVRLDTADVDDLEIGATVEVTVGEAAPDTGAAQGFEEAREVLDAEVLEAAPAVPAVPPPAAPASPPYTNSVTVVMVNPAGGVRDSTTLADVVSAVNGPVADFWEQETDARYKFGVTASHDWIDTDASCEDPYALWDEVADTVGFVEGHGKHLLLYVTSTPGGLPGCEYGLGEIGWAYNSQASFAYVRDVNTSLIAHELGHNLSLNHSSSLNCTQYGYEWLCGRDDYGDLYDVMGYTWEQLGSLNLVQAGAISLVSAQAFDIGSSGAATVSIDAVSQRAGRRAVVLRDDEYMKWWLEYRPASGRDAWLGTPDNLAGLQPGVLLRATNSTHAYSTLLDGTPSPQAEWGEDFDYALPIGTPVRINVDGGYYVVTVQSVSSTSASILVEPRRNGSYRPIGAVETLTAEGSTITVTGWSINQDWPTQAVPMDVWIDGVHVAAEVMADRSRPDIGTANPGAGDAHGYSWSGAVSPGAHNVCVYGTEWDRPIQREWLGCRSITIRQALPLANWEGLSASGSTLTVSGWAFDPDSPNTASQVHLYVDGQGTAVTANGSRPDVGAAFGVGSSHGFSWSGTVAPGAHTVCAYAIDLDQAWRNVPLGCRSIATQVALPSANWEVLSASGSTVTVAGWAFDTDSPTGSVPIHVYVDGRGTAISANGSRPDVGAFFPGVGSSHGFSWTGTVVPGVHTVCAYAIDPEFPFRNAALGCRSITTQLALPVANWEVLSASGSTVTVAGWAFDTDSPSGAVPVHVYVDGQGTAISANGSRPDVGEFFPGVGNSRGFTWSGAVAPGRHTVCVYAVDADLPWRNSALGCRTIDTQVTPPRANWEVLSASGSTLTVSGWALDPDSGTAPNAVHVYVDGQGTAVSANGSRPDVGAFYPGAGNDHGFSHTATVGPGVHRVCVYAIDGQIGWLNTPLGCRSITL